MEVVLWIIGGYMVVMGALLCAKPLVGKRLADVWMKDKIHRGWALVTVGVGVLLLWAAPAGRATLFIQVLGCLSVLKGIYLLIAPRAQLMGVVTWWNRLPQMAHRVWGVVALAMGAVIITTR